MEKSNTNLILMISILLFLLFGGSFVYLFKIIENKNRHTSAIISTLNNKIAEKENVDVLNKRMLELGDMKKRIGSYLVDTGEVDTFVGYLESMGVNDDVELSVKNVEVPKNEKNKILLTIDMRGSFENIFKTIYLLENAPYSINVTSLYLNKEVKEENFISDISLGATPSKLKVIPTSTKSIWQATLSFNVLSL